MTQMTQMTQNTRGARAETSATSAAAVAAAERRSYTSTAIVSSTISPSAAARPKASTTAGSN